MSRMTVTQLSENFFHFFSSIADGLAKETGFVQRQSKLTGSLFLSAFISSCFSNKVVTLENICAYLSSSIQITKQALHERINHHTVEFLSKLFHATHDLFVNEHPILVDLLSHFTGVYLLDSSIIQLPKSMSIYYQGFGGERSHSALKIQVVYDYLKSQLTFFDITPARENDQGYRKHLQTIKPGALYLQDLGYFCLASFKEFFCKKAFIISRLLCIATVYEPESGEKLNMLEVISKMGTESFSFNVCIGKKERLPFRLVGRRVPAAVAEKRRREARKEARERKYTPKKTTLGLLDWSIYITNIPAEIANAEQIILLYTVRWQIELFFKLCKSEAGIDETLGKRPARIMCEFYAKMLSVVIALFLVSLVVREEEKEISHIKAYSRLGLFGREFFESLSSNYRLKKFIDKFLEVLEKYAMKDRWRKKRKSTYQRLIDATKQEVAL